MNPEQVPNAPQPLENKIEESTIKDETNHEHAHFDVPEYTGSKETLGYLKIFVFSFIIIALLGFLAYFFLIKMTSNTAIPLTPAAAPNTPTLGQTSAYAPTSASEASSSMSVAVPLPNESYQSKLNKKVSFLVPVGSTVIENGSVSAITFNIESPDDKSYILSYSKVAEGCFDAIGSFKIGAEEGVDFRIIQDNKEVTLKNNLHALRLFEMYGSYEGMVGFRGNACLQSAVPTRIEIKASGYGRYEGSKAYLLFDEIINSIRV